MLEVKHISKRFGEHQVLADVSLKVNQGDVVVILGPSGSGKTTFLRCLNHLEKADSGQLTLSGKDYDLAKLSKKEILEIRRKTAFVFQHYNLFANKTALENILEGLVVARKIPKEEAIQRAMATTSKPEDAVIIAGKGADCYQIVNGVKEEYPGDAAIAERYL